MGGKYIPPALRGKTSNNDHDIPPGQKLFTPDEIAEHFGYPATATEKSTDPVADAQGDVETTEGDKNPTTRQRGTLNTTYDDQDKLAYIVLFHHANPMWKTKSEIFCKTNLDLLPEPSTLTSSENDKPAYEKSYPVFMQRKRLNGDDLRGIGFYGYYGIQTVRYLEAESEELVEYLQVKFGERGRDREAWKKSLSKKWAVVTMGRDEDRKDEEPQIERSQRGVNDMLAEMRLKS